MAWVFWLPPSVFEAKGLLAFDGTGANQLRLGVLDTSGGQVVQADVNLYAFQAMTVMGPGRNLA
jgi:hypothetical protein